jgi:hypothetical protein
MSLLKEVTISHPQQSVLGSIRYTINHNSGKPVLFHRCHTTNGVGKIAENYTNHYNTSARYGMMWGQDEDVPDFNSYSVSIGRISSTDSSPFDLVIQLYG